MRVARLLVLGVALAVVTSVLAQDKKEEELKGTITCAKCDLKKESKCMTVIKVKKGDKDVVYYFDKDSHKKNHGQICTTPKEGSVKGVLSKEGDKDIVTVKKIEFKD